MKTLFLIRHAKAVPHSFNVIDFERPLNEQGQNDAAMMAQKLILEGIEIDTFITSTALRAITTCKTFATAYNIDHNEIITLGKLYDAPYEVFYDIIEGLNDKINNVAIFAHNPGITEMASLQTTPMEFIDMPTCGIFAVKIEIDAWKNFRKGVKEKLFFKYPKEY
jgi:phosphohistidine phosphatase